MLPQQSTTVQNANITPFSSHDREDSHDELIKVKARFLYAKFKDKKSGYSICVYWTKDKEKFTCTGYNLPEIKGVTFELTGKEKRHPKYGNHLEITSFEESIEGSKDAMVAFLSSGFIKGIGKKKATLIYDMFGNECLKIIEKEPLRLTYIKGFSMKSALKANESYMEHVGARDISVLLAPFGIMPNLSMAVYKMFGKDAASLIKQNPYLLCRIKGIGFTKADKIAKSIDVSLDLPDRLTSGMTHILKENEMTGDTGMELNHFGAASLALLGCDVVGPNEINSHSHNLIKIMTYLL